MGHLSYIYPESTKSFQQQLAWRNWLARQTNNLKAVSSILTVSSCDFFCHFSAIFFVPLSPFNIYTSHGIFPLTLMPCHLSPACPFFTLISQANQSFRAENFVQCMYDLPHPEAPAPAFGVKNRPELRPQHHDVGIARHQGIGDNDSQ